MSTNVFQPIENYLKAFAEINNNTSGSGKKSSRTSESSSIPTSDGENEETSPATSNNNLASRASPPLNGPYTLFFANLK
jgi:hypothetical protein